jgi:hypothetical protein
VKHLGQCWARSAPDAGRRAIHRRSRAQAYRAPAALGLWPGALSRIGYGALPAGIAWVPYFLLGGTLPGFPRVTDKLAVLAAAGSLR